MSKKEETLEQIKEIVIARIDAQMPSHLKLSVGSYGTMSKEEMIKHVKKDDLMGKQIVRAHMSFLKSLVSGEFRRAMVSVENE